MHARDDVIEHGGHGRLLQYDPETKHTQVLLSGLEFANGVALAQDESFVLVTETGNYDIVRYWLKGEKAGTSDIFTIIYPGIPDGISSNREGVFWVALFAPEMRCWILLHLILGLEKSFSVCPVFLQPQPARHAFVLGLNEDGQVVANLQDNSPAAFAPVTSVKQHRNTLYLGNLTQDSFAAFTFCRRSKIKRWPAQQESNLRPSASEADTLSI